MRVLDRCVAAAVSGAAVLVLPLAFLLFVQWPLREVVQAGSRQANDLGQVLFALYAAVAVTAATRGKVHLAADLVAHRYSPRWRGILTRASALLIAAPASAYTLYAAGPLTWQSILQLERFPETFNPGYFLVRVAAFVLAALVLAQALLDAFAPRQAPRP
ncbi:MAG TPA: TRAP transporter small permease subunit [Usitatibacter sp.]|nr:TRAP transporter small permease subunit [Usitatibacter sp.]